MTTTRCALGALLTVVLLQAPAPAEVKGGNIQVQSVPEARIFLDNKYIGTTSKDGGKLRITLVWPKGHVVRAEREGFEPLEAIVLVEDERTADCNLKDMVPLPPPPERPAVDPEVAGRLVVTSFPIACTITCETLGLDGLQKIANPLILEGLEPGKHSLQLVALGKTLKNRAVISTGKTTELVADFHRGKKGKVYDPKGKPPAPLLGGAKKPKDTVEIPGFTLLRFEEFTCGESTNIVPIYRCDMLAQAIELPAESSAADVEFALLPGGHFQMGSPASSPVTEPDEKLHSVEVQPLLIGLTEVTQRVWRALAPAAGLEPRPSSMYGSDLLPVERVSWDECQKFCEAIGLRLPTEEEWEYACRAGNSTHWCMADRHDTLPEFAWYSYEKLMHAHDVAGRQPNAFGLYDVHGNVGEWCQTTYEGDKMVHRGGGFTSDAIRCRAANRFWGVRSAAFQIVGLRLAASVP